MKTSILTLSTGAVIFLAACSTPKLSGYAAKTDLTGKAKYDFNRSKIKESGRGYCL